MSKKEKVVVNINSITYQKLKEQGLCVDCREPVTDGYTRCEKCRKRNALAHNGKKQEFIEMGICPICRKEPLFGQEKTCPVCRAKNTEMTLKAREKDPEHYNKVHREWSRIEYQRRKEQGLCVRCGKRKAYKGLRCGICAEKDLQARHAREPLKLPRSERVKNGICYFCDRPIKPGYKVCETHYQMNVEKSRKRKEKEILNSLIKAPCKDCDFRQVGCHSRCPAYIDYQKRMKDYKAKVRKDKEADLVIEENKSRFWEDVRKKGLHIGS